MHRKQITRRRFIQATTVLAAGSLLPSCAATGPASKVPPSAVDQVVLGKTGLKLSRLGFGTGSIGGSIQRALGQEKFSELLRYAYHQGITYIDTAQNYGTHEMVREAIKPLPREKLFIQTKMPGVPDKPLEVLDRYRRELGIDYIDSVLTHCAVKPDWQQQRRPVLDALEKAKSKGIIRAHGVSCHSLPALTAAAASDWVDVNLVRVNPQGSHMDTPAERWDAKSNASHVGPVLERMRLMRKNGHGIIGMKIIGNGDFTKAEDRERSIRFAMQPNLLDAVVIGFKNTAEVDEAIERINSALARRV